MGLVQRQGLLNSVAYYIGIGVGFVNKIFLFPHFLATDALGLVNVMAYIAVLYAQFASLGFTNVILRYFPFFEDRAKHHHGFFSFTMMVTFLVFVVITLLFLVLRPVVVGVYAKAPLLVEYYYYLIPLGLFALWTTLFEAYLRSLYKTVVPTFVREVFLRLANTLAISLFAFGWVDFQTFVQIYVVVNCVTAVILFLYLAWLKQLFLRPRPSRRLQRLRKGMLVYGGFAMMGNFSQTLLVTVDILMIPAILGEAANGIYTTLVYVLVVALVPSRALYKVISPRVAEYWRDKAMDKMKQLYREVSIINLVIGQLIMIGIVLNLDHLFAPPFLPAEFAAGKWALMILALGRLVDLGTGINGIIMVTSKKYRIDLGLTLSMVVLAIIANALLIPRFGLNGAAWATTLTATLFNIVRIGYVSWFFKMQPFSPKTITTLFIAGVTLVVGLLLPRAESMLLDLTYRSAIVVLLYGVLTLRLRVSDQVNAYVLNVAESVGLGRLVKPLV